MIESYFSEYLAVMNIVFSSSEFQKLKKELSDPKFIAGVGSIASSKA